jgi:hypothetical protein
VLKKEKYRIEVGDKGKKREKGKRESPPLVEHL